MAFYFKNNLGFQSICKKMVFFYMVLERTKEEHMWLRRFEIVLNVKINGSANVIYQPKGILKMTLNDELLPLNKPNLTGKKYTIGIAAVLTKTHIQLTRQRSRKRVLFKSSSVKYEPLSFMKNLLGFYIYGAKK